MLGDAIYHLQPNRLPLNNLLKNINASNSSPLDEIPSDKCVKEISSPPDISNAPKQMIISSTDDMNIAKQTLETFDAKSYSSGETENLASEIICTTALDPPGRIGNAKKDESLEELKLEDNNLSEVKEREQIYHRFLFNTRKQEIGETLRNFAFSLQILSKSCHYDADEALIHSLIRDRFIAGLRESSIQLDIINQVHHVPINKEDSDRKKFQGKTEKLSLEDAIELACMLEENVRSQHDVKFEKNEIVFQSQHEQDSQDVTHSTSTISVIKSKEPMIQDNDVSNHCRADQNIELKAQKEYIENGNQTESENLIHYSLNVKRAKLHKRVRKNEGQIYNCQYCTEYFSNKKGLTKHLRQFHVEEEKVSCEECGKEFENKIKMQKHFESVHKGTGIVCQLCLNCYKSQACLKAHVRVKHEAGGEKVCLICFQIMADDKELKKHTTELHNDGGMICNICNKQLRMDESLRSHLKKKHSEDGKTICPYCGKMFSLIEQHIAKDHSTDEWKKCEQCDFTGSKHMIQCHVYYYHPKGPELICDTCGYRTPHNSVLKQHIRMVHQKIKPYSCGKCHRSFFSESRLKDHDIVFHKNQMFSCEKCHKSYKIRRQLQVHIRSVHQGIWVHCPQCNLKFAENHDLKRHKKHVHDRNYTFNCDHCARGFPFSTRLKEHMQKHHNILV